MKKSLLTFIALIICIPLLAQIEPANEIFIYFNKGVVSTPSISNKTSAYIVEVRNPILKRALSGLDIQENDLIIVAPDFNKSDTIKVLPDGKVLKKPDRSKLYRLKVKEHQNQADLIKKLRSLPEVLYAEPRVFTRPANAVPNDTFYTRQWPFVSTGTQPGINAPAAWDIFKGSSNNIIAIIDYGVDASHEDLSAKMAGGDIGTAVDGHGTRVAGVAAARTNNKKGVAGVDWNARIHSQRIDAGTGSNSDVAQAIYDAVDYNDSVYVLNNSWHLNADSEDVRRAFAYAYKANRTAVAAMGNFHDGSDIIPQGGIAYPAGFSNVIAVGATDRNDLVKGYSSRGNHIDVTAPTNIYTTYYMRSYEETGGTSVATAVVSGIASLLKGYNPLLYNDDIENIIELSVDDKGSPGFDPDYGWGRVNAEKALKLLTPPYNLTHHTAVGGTPGTPSSQFPMKFIDVSLFTDGTYTVSKRAVTKSVSLPTSNCQVLGVWGVGYTSTGWSEANTNFGVGFTEVVPGSLTSTSVTLRTYIYDIFNSNGVKIGTYPTSPENIVFGYSILAENYQNAFISGPSDFCNTATFILEGVKPGETVTWSTANSKFTLASNGGNSVTVTKKPNDQDTDELIATISTSCGTITFSKLINGNQIPSDFAEISSVATTSGMTVGYPYYFEVTEVPGAISYDWYSDGGVTFANAIGNIIEGTAQYEAPHIIGVVVNFACGSMLVPEIMVETTGYNIVYNVSPNPATGDYIEVSAMNPKKIEDNNTNNFDTLKDAKIEFYDKYNRLISTHKFTNGKSNISTRDLPNDIYIVKVINGKIMRSKKVIISR